MKEKDLDKATIDAYQQWVQKGIRRDLNSVSLGPGKLPFMTAVFLIIFAFACLLVGILLITLRMRHVYLWDWDAQFLGPFFFIMFLLCMAGATYLIILSKRRSNKYRSQLYFKPVGDWGAACIHESELAREEEMKHELKSGTTPHKTVKPRSEAYSHASKEARRQRPPGYPREGRENKAYDKSPLDANKPFRPEDRRRPHPAEARRDAEGRRGPPPDGRRGPPPDGRRPPGDRRGPPPGDRRGPPGERRGPPPDGRRGPRGPPPNGRNGPPPGDRPPRGPDDRPRGPDDRPRRPDDRPRGPPPDYYDDRPTNGQRSPPPGRAARIPPNEGGRPPRGAPRFGNVERIPDSQRRDAQLIFDRSTEDESNI